MLDTIPFTTSPYCHNMNSDYPGSDYGIDKSCYSGRWFVRVQEWGVYVINVDTGVFKMKSPVSKIEPDFQPGPHMIDGDCWQSGIWVAASADTPKWVVVTGAPDCPDVDTGEPAGEIQVLHLDNSFDPLTYVGQIFAPKVNRNSAHIRIFGDIAYVRQSVSGSPPVEKWTLVDLNSMTVTAEDLTGIPDATPQTNIDDYTYTIVPGPPSPQGAPVTFTAVRSDQQPPPPGGGGLPLIPITVQVASVPSSIDHLTQVSGGHNYTNATATVHGGGGSGGTINVAVNGDGSLTLALGNHGTGYLTTPSAVIDGDGSGAAANLFLDVPDQSVEYTVTNLNTGVTTSIGLVSAPPYNFNWQADQWGRLKITARLLRGNNAYTSYVFITIAEPTP